MEFTAVADHGCSQGGTTSIGVAMGAKGAMPPSQIFRKYSHFVH